MTVLANLVERRGELIGIPRLLARGFRFLQSLAMTHGGAPLQNTAALQPSKPTAELRPEQALPAPSNIFHRRLLSAPNDASAPQLSA